MQYRARVVVIYVFTAPVRRFGRLCATIIGERGRALDARKTDSAPGIKRSQHCLVPTDGPPGA